MIRFSVIAVVYLDVRNRRARSWAFVGFWRKLVFCAPTRAARDADTELLKQAVEHCSTR